MTDKQKLLIAEDDTNILTLLKMMLEESFSVVTAEDGLAAVELIEQHNFDLVLLDIHLPGRDGLSICAWLNALDVIQKPVVIILSADDNEETIKKAYDLGARDYVCKPFNIVAFNEHISRFSKDLEHIRQLEQNDKQYQSLADTAMKQAAFYGQGLEIMAALNSCVDELAMARMVTKALMSLGFHTAIELRNENDSVSYDVDNAECSPVELQVFDLLKDKGRIYHFGRRAIFNDQYVSLLVKLMPAVGSPSYDAMLDLAAKLVPAINSRLISFHYQQRMLDTKDRLMMVIDMVNRGIGDMEKERQILLESIAAKIGMSFHALELQEHQEAFFLELIEKELQANSISEKFIELQHVIADCIQTLQLDNLTAASSNEDDAVNTQDIELF